MLLRKLDFQNNFLKCQDLFQKKQKPSLENIKQIIQIQPDLAKNQNKKIEVISRVLFPNSAGVLYQAFTQYLGFKNYGYLGAALGNGISYLVGGVCIIIAWVLGLLSVRPKNYLEIKYGQLIILIRELKVLNMK